MLNLTFCDLYKYYKVEKKVKITNIQTSYLFVYRSDISKLDELKLSLDNNLKKLIFFLKNYKIDFIFIFYEEKIVIHSSGVSINKNGPDKFFFEFQNNSYGVIGPTYTNTLYRGKQFYKFAIEMQICKLINKYHIDEIFISTKHTKKILTPFKLNNLKKFSSGIMLSILNKFFIYIIYNKPFRIRIFMNDNLIVKLK